MDKIQKYKIELALQKKDQIHQIQFEEGQSQGLKFILWNKIGKIFANKDLNDILERNSYTGRCF